MKTLWRMLLELLGFPTPPRPEQIGERLVTMRQLRDCHNAAVATACNVSYEKAHQALWHFNLPWILESPLLSNPINVERGVKALGFNSHNIGLSALLQNTVVAGKAIVLVHDPKSPLLAQHWVVWFGRDMAGNHRLHWGNSQEFVLKTDDELIGLVTAGWPNCIIEVHK
jgi:hypothetical protein